MAKVVTKGLFLYYHKVCHSHIEYSYDELVTKSHTDYLGDTDYYNTLKCPACGKEIIIREPL